MFTQIFLYKKYTEPLTPKAHLASRLFFEKFLTYSKTPLLALFKPIFIDALLGFFQIFQLDRFLERDLLHFMVYISALRARPVLKSNNLILSFILIEKSTVPFHMY